MKSILLASASVVAFAGAAAAEVTFGGSAELGYNNETADGEGFFWSADLAVTLSQALDNGLTASATFGIDIAQDNNVEGDDQGDILTSNDYLLSLTSESAGLYFGNTEFAAANHWTGVDGTDATGFSEEDGETVLRGDVTFGGVAASVSYAVDEAADSLEQLSVGASGAFGAFTFALGYQEETDYAGVGGDFNSDGVFGVTVGTTFGGATVNLEYSQNQTDEVDSIGVGVSYPFGPVTVAAYYAMQDAGDDYGVSVDYASGAISVSAYFDAGDDEDSDWGVEGAYDVGNGVTAQAGVTDAGEDFYVAGLVALGADSTLGLSYAEDGDGDAGDEIGDPEYKDGATVWVSFAF